jgi:hypothetical protein
MDVITYNPLASSFTGIYLPPNSSSADDDSLIDSI